MRLDRLLGDVKVRHLRGDAATEVSSVSYSSGAVVPGALFCCLPGLRSDGHDFAAAAAGSGAVALLCARELPLDIAQAVVDDPRAAMATAAAEMNGHPSRRLEVVGVTGTNGKTTTTLFLQAVLETAGMPAAVIGTLSGPRTTPEAPELQARLSELVGSGTRAVALEVSSHALAQHRVDATWFEVAVFTNLSPDHLDFHAGMEDYFAAKATLFEPERAGVAVVNAGDEWGRRLLASVRLPTRPFSLADAADLAVARSSATFAWDGHPVRLRLGGTFNVSNALAAATAARELGVPSAAIAEGLSSVDAVPGRFQLLEAGQPFTVIVDYAHTPAGLEECLSAARLAAEGHLLTVVFGCGGGRDHAKRPAMGEVAARLADRAVITSDNPRGEDPDAIIAAVRAGAGPGAAVVTEPDRRAAIALALAGASAGDVVVLAGKGHERTQEIGPRMVPFDDRVVALEELERLGW